jgi:phosphoglycolate phosphatase
MARLILFDIDSTLISSNHAGRTAMDRAFFEVFGIEEATAGASFDGRTDHAIYLEVIARHNLSGGGDPLDAFRRAVAAYLREIGPALVQRSGHVLPGVQALLATFSAGQRPGLATGNIREGARAKLSHFGLWDCFVAGGFGDDSPVRADLVRDGIANLAAALDIEPDPRDCLVVGDTPLDVEAAHLAGARALGVASGRYSLDELFAAHADWALPDLTDTPTVLRILHSSS